VPKRALTLPLPWFVQRRSPALADIIGGRRVRTCRDDFLGIDALQVNARGAEIRVPELALDDVQRHALARELVRVRVAQLMRREAAPDASLGREPPELARTAARPRSPAGRSVDDAEQRPDRQFARGSSHGRSCSQPQSSIPTSRRRPPFPWRTSTDPRRASRSCSASASASWMRPAPEHNQHRAQPPSVPVLGGVAHHGDDLIDGGRVSPVADALVRGGRPAW
jgi:hypothetical protein